MPTVQSSLKTNDAILEVALPAEAKVYVNDNLTSTPGDLRRYVSRNLLEGEVYTYEVRAEVMRDGEVVAQTKVIDLAAGTEKRIQFDFEPVESVVTTLKLNVPENARVTLSGVETNMTGPQRVFTSNQLRKGESWSDYQVVVEYEQDGQTLRREQTIDLAAGEVRELDFEFGASTSLASAR